MELERRPTSLPESLVKDSAESLLAQYGRRSFPVYWLFLVGTTAAVVSLPFVQVDVTTEAAGRIRSDSKRMVCVAPVAGFLSRLKAQENESVQRGQTLFVLRSEALAAEERRLADQGEQLAGELHDLAYLLEKVSLEAAVRQDEFRTAKYLTEFRVFAGETDGFRLQTTRAAREVARYTTLFARGSASGRELDDWQHSLAEANLSLENARRKAIERWQADAALKRPEQQRLAVDVARNRAEQRLQTVAAPVSGSLIGLDGLKEGSYVQAGQRLGEISPDGDLVVESLVAPKDIGRVFEGQPVKIQVDGFFRAEWGSLPGRLAALSRDAVGSDPLTGYQAVVRPEREWLRRRDGLTATLKKGMTARVRFLLGRKTLWQLLTNQVDGLFLDARAGRPPGASVTPG